MPINAVEKPLEETKPEDSASSDSDDDDSPPELEEHDAAAMHQRSEVRHSCCFSLEIFTLSQQFMRLFECYFLDVAVLDPDSSYNFCISLA